MSDFFNYTFFIYLGILVLIGAVLVVYYESKQREQNHRMQTMFSLVSTLAQELNQLKLGVHMLSAYKNNPDATLDVNSIYNDAPSLSNAHAHSLGNTLIEVSDESDSDIDSDEHDIDTDNIDTETDINTDSEEEQEGGDSKVKLVQLDIGYCIPSFDELIEENLDEEEDVDISLKPEYVEQVLDLKYDEDSNLKEHIIDIEQQQDIANISIHLGEKPIVEAVDFRKMQLPKLRSIVVEKQLSTTSEANKMKKSELLKLLGIE